MKKEIQIAEENIKSWKFTKPQDKELWRLNIYLSKCQQHKASCERDVPKLEKIKESIVYIENELCHHLIDEMIEDKKQTIKLYNEAGI
ncbi:hypothetical protein LCGC14_0462430 [marine sediment metagenome]|uniref:Uncharacterized protein n=1 Tax=marine sediment metagenome TaxID=412755 RepID=A0A0F9SK03_9ZZZZ